MFNALVASHPDFGWVNVYRPRDYIGREVGFSETPRCADLSTNEQHLHGLATHSNYWSDPVVWDNVGPALNAMKDLNPSEPDVDTPRPMIWPSDNADDSFEPTLKYLENNRTALGWIIKTLVFSAIPLIACISIIVLPYLQYRAVSLRAIETSADILCSVGYSDPQVGIPNSSGSYSVVSCAVTFTDNTGLSSIKKPANRVDLDSLPLQYDSTLGRGFQVEGDDVKIAYEPGKPDSVIVKSGTVHNAADTRTFRLLATPLDWLFTKLFGVIITSALFTLLLFKPLLALTVAVESFFGIDSGAYRDSLAG